MTTGKEHQIFCNVNCKIQERNDIIIKPADKGSAVVVMDKTTYIQEAERQLSNCRFYEKLDSDPTLDFTQKIMRAVVYLLDCHVCGSQYVGESINPFNKRMNGHRIVFLVDFRQQIEMAWLWIPVYTCPQDRQLKTGRKISP
jgi:hypothetical protein